MKEEYLPFPGIEFTLLGLSTRNSVSISDRKMTARYLKLSRGLLTFVQKNLMIFKLK